MSMTKALMIGFSRLEKGVKQLGSFFQEKGMRKDGSGVGLSDRVVFEEAYGSKEHGEVRRAYICFVKPHLDQRVVYIGKSGQPLAQVLKIKLEDGEFKIDNSTPDRGVKRTRRCDRWTEALKPVGIAKFESDPQGW